VERVRGATIGGHLCFGTGLIDLIGGRSRMFAFQIGGGHGHGGKDGGVKQRDRAGEQPRRGLHA
jgi:hypothetical protein